MIPQPSPLGLKGSYYIVAYCNGVIYICNIINAIKIKPMNLEDIKDPVIRKAIQDIVTYNTLPSQIDYRLPYRIKAQKAELFLQTLPNGSDYLAIAVKETDAYYTPTESGLSPSDYDEMF